MDAAQKDRRYTAGDTVKLEIVLRHQANLKEVRAIFAHNQDKSVPPLMARGQPRPISERGADGSITSRLEAEITLPRAVTPGFYDLERISYETGGGRLGHLEDMEVPSNTPRMAFEVVGEPADSPILVDIAFTNN